MIINFAAAIVFSLMPVSAPHTSDWVHIDFCIGISCCFDDRASCIEACTSQGPPEAGCISSCESAFFACMSQGI